MDTRSFSDREFSAKEWFAMNLEWMMEGDVDIYAQRHFKNASESNPTVKNERAKTDDRILKYLEVTSSKIKGWFQHSHW